MTYCEDIDTYINNYVFKVIYLSTLTVRHVFVSLDYMFYSGLIYAIVAVYMDKVTGYVSTTSWPSPSPVTIARQHDSLVGIGSMN
jgi:hypothetical protein